MAVLLRVMSVFWGWGAALPVLLTSVLLVGLCGAVILDGLFADRHRSSAGTLKTDSAPVNLTECQIPLSHLYPLFTNLSLRLLCHGDVELDLSTACSLC